MFLKATNKVLKEDNTTELKSILVEMDNATEETPQEERTKIYYDAVRKALNILSDNWKYILMWGQNELVDAKLNEDTEYNLSVKSTTMQVEAEDIYLLK